MKKQIATLTAITLAAALLSGCSEKKNNPTPAEGNNLSMVQSTSPSTESTPSESTSEPESAPKERFIYGETEIPDLAFESGEYTEGTHLNVQPDGRININGHGKERYDDRLLESMVFETHTFLDYTIRLVGDDVRMDREHFPGIIYTKHLRVEVENNTEIPSRFSIENKCSSLYYFSVYPVGDFYSEELIFEDQIGNYLDIYDTKCPVIAMRYFNADDIDESLRNIVEFVWIKDGKIVDRPLGKSAENTGVCLLEFSPSGFYAIFTTDEFKIENENTLIDEEAGIKYIFDFDKTDDSGHYYSTERIQ